MYALIVRIKVKPGYRDRYIEEAIGDALGSIRDEPGCLRFDVLADTTDPNALYFYEVYTDEAAFEIHKQQPHMRAWAEAVKDWNDGPATVHFATTVFPADAKWQKQPA
jgi:autoinducer 2-degrading protein